MSVSIEEYEKALASLQEAVQFLQKPNISSAEEKMFRDAAIQRFEFCVELAWKTACKLMGSSTTAPKVAVREMAQNGFIGQVELWLAFIDARNESSHTYDEAVAKKVEGVLLQFLPEGVSLLKHFQKK